MSTVLPEGTTTTAEPLWLDDGPIRGAGVGVTTLVYTGEGAAIRSHDPLCRAAEVSGLTIRAEQTCLALANVYQGRFTDLSLIARGGIAIDLTGTPDTSTHYNRFRDCDLIASQACVRIDGPANANQFRGGCWSGHGMAVWMPGTDHTTGTNQFWGVAMATTGADTDGDIIRLGGSGGRVNDTQFYGCRIEAAAPPAVIRLGKGSARTTFSGGTLSNEVSVVQGSRQGNHVEVLNRAS